MDTRAHRSPRALTARALDQLLERLADTPTPGRGHPARDRRPRHRDPAPDRCRDQRRLGSLGVTHWSSRLLASELGLGHATIARVWRKWNLQPWRVETFKFSTDPELDAKVRDVVVLYLNPPENAVVLSIDEKSQVQALDRTQPTLPVGVGSPSSRPTTTSATAPPRCSLRWTWPPVRSLTPATRGIATRSSSSSSSRSRRAYPRVPLHVVCDNYATHVCPESEVMEM